MPCLSTALNDSSRQFIKHADVRRRALVLHLLDQRIDSAVERTGIVPSQVDEMAIVEINLGSAARQVAGHGAIGVAQRGVKCPGKGVGHEPPAKNALDGVGMKWTNPGQPNTCAAEDAVVF